MRAAANEGSRLREGTGGSINNSIYTGYAGGTCTTSANTPSPATVGVLFISVGGGVSNSCEPSTNWLQH